MFNSDEVEFIEETAKKDMIALNNKIEHVTNEMARNGKQLCDLKTVQSKLASILQAIKDNRGDEDGDNN